jgi:hypothetical protein
MESWGAPGPRAHHWNNVSRDFWAAADGWTFNGGVQVRERRVLAAQRGVHRLAASPDCMSCARAPSGLRQLIPSMA